jgi:hypothetical protein
MWSDLGKESFYVSLAKLGKDIKNYADGSNKLLL